MSAASEFEADLCPTTHAPRIRFNFSNGWSASVVLRQLTRGTDCDYQVAALACCPTGMWRTGLTELGESEACAQEVAEYLAQIASRPRLQGGVQ